METDILRVFPRVTVLTPTIDKMVRIGTQTQSLPPHREIHISCTFTWDMDCCEYLRDQYQAVTDKPVLLGGPAYGSPCGEHIPGMYTKKGVIFTSRGCNNHCPWCFVPAREGKLRELEIKPGHIIQDNNFLQCSRRHKDKVFDMLRGQEHICFKGGLEPDLVDEHFINSIVTLTHKWRGKTVSSVDELWLACDTDSRFPQFAAACKRLTEAGFNREKIHCYVLSYGKDRKADEARAAAVYRAGAMPFMQLYRDSGRIMTEYDPDTNAWARSWQRPAAIRKHMEQGTNYWEFHT